MLHICTVRFGVTLNLEKFSDEQALGINHAQALILRIYAGKLHESLVG